MFPGLVIGVAAFVCGMISAMTRTVVVFQKVDKVNERLPEERQFSHLWWLWPAKNCVRCRNRKLKDPFGVLRPEFIHVTMLGVPRILLILKPDGVFGTHNIFPRALVPIWASTTIPSTGC